MVHLILKIDIEASAIRGIFPIICKEAFGAFKRFFFLLETLPKILV
jgi:hypothetical protein